MKYTIELTEKQRKRFKHMNNALIKMGMGFDILSLLKPINVEDTNEYQIGYKEGRKDGFAYCRENTELIPELKKTEYTNGYNTGINDYNKMIQWLHDCTDDFKEFMNKEYGYDVMYLTNPKVDEGVMLYDLICDHDIAEVISEFQRWQEEMKKAKEKKKAEIIKKAEEIIKEGDIVKFNEKCLSYHANKDREYLVLHVFENGLATLLYDNGDTGAAEISLLDKTGRHIEVQLLDKLKG